MERSRIEAAAASIPRSKARHPLVRLGGLAALVIVAWLVGHQLGWFDYRHAVEHINRIRQSHSLSAFVIELIVATAIGTAIGLPGLPFTVAAGVFFGTVLGAVLSWTGVMFGAVIGYWLARGIGHNEVLKWASRICRVNAAVEQARDFTGLLTLRLVPVFPVGTVNFIGGLARAKFGTYLAATAIGIAPAMIIYSYFADSLAEGVGPGRQRALSSLLISSALLIVLSLAPKLIRRSSH